MSDSFLNDFLDLAHEQGWGTERTRGGSFKFKPPPGRAQPGYELIHIFDGRNNPRWHDEVRTKLKRGGLKFPDERSKARKPNSMATQPAPKTNGSNGIHPATPAIAEHSGSSPFQKMRQRVSDAMNSLSAIESLVCELEVIAAEVQKDREAFERLTRRG